MKRGELGAVCVVLLVWVGPAAGATLHVDVAGGGRFTSLQAALDAAANGDQIQVAPGTYTESINFHGKAVRLYSSAGAALTIIDGAGSYHVVQCVSGEGAGTVLEGFTITGGNANGDCPDYRGAGMYNVQTSPTVTDCIFRGNAATDSGGGMCNLFSDATVTRCAFTDNAGGGMYNLECNPIVTHCTFTGNSGGGMCNVESSPTVSDCTFTGNSAYQGGGLYTGGGSPTVSNSTFTGNSAEFWGGGLLSYGDPGHPTVAHCTFCDNSAQYGGGIISSGSLTVARCAFHGNSAESGGAVFGIGDQTVLNCTFRGNAAADRGGALYSEGGMPMLSNCIFSANKADLGGGLFYYGGPTITNCTFSGNLATSGGGICKEERGWGVSVVTNCVLWLNADAQIAGTPTTVVVTYSDVQGRWPGLGNIDADPLFVNASGGDYHLAAGSPCIDTGMDSPPGGLPPTDIEGNPRPLDGNGNGAARADMGAYEVSLATADQRLTDLIEDVLDLHLEPAVRTSLTAPLYTALRLVTDGNARNDASAAGALQGFLKTVAAYRGTRLAPADADALTAAAQAIIARLSGK
jgi:predicted outer membrane repeat protein